MAWPLDGQRWHTSYLPPSVLVILFFLVIILCLKYETKKIKAIAGDNPGGQRTIGGGGAGDMAITTVGVAAVTAAGFGCACEAGGCGGL